MWYNKIPSICLKIYHDTNCHCVPYLEENTGGDNGQNGGEGIGTGGGVMPQKE